MRLTAEHIFLRSICHFIGLKENLEILRDRKTLEPVKDNKGREVKNPFLEHYGRIQKYISSNHDSLLSKLNNTSFSDTFLEHAEKLAKVNDLFCILPEKDINDLISLLLAKQNNEVKVVKPEQKEHFEMFFKLYHKAEDKNKFMSLMTGI